MPRNMTQSGPTLASPTWAGDYAGREHLVPGGAKLDPAQFVSAQAVRVDVGAAGAAGGATSIPVSPVLTGPIPSGATLHFGTNKFAILSAAAATGAATLTVLAIPVALVDADIANYVGTEKKTVLSGTPVGRTLAERDASTPFGPAVDTDDEVFLIYHDVTDADDDNDIELYRHQSIVKENFLPGWTGHAAGLKTKLRTLYRMVRGAE